MKGLTPKSKLRSSAIGTTPLAVVGGKRALHEKIGEPGDEASFLWFEMFGKAHERRVLWATPIDTGPCAFCMRILNLASAAPCCACSC
jgi:hypothetical protein